MGELLLWGGLLLLLLNGVAFVLMGYDKRMALQGFFRIPEKLFLGLALIGGAAGIYVGMKTFRHKTKKLAFFFGIPSLMVVHIATSIYMLFLKQ